jgi:hypothetical protein
MNSEFLNTVKNGVLYFACLCVLTVAIAGTVVFFLGHH